VTLTLLGRDVNVSVPMAAATDGIAVSAALVEALAEVVDYAKAGRLAIDWSSLKVGVEADVFRGSDALLPPLRVRVRVHADAPKSDGVVEGLTAIARELHERAKRDDGPRPL
jgi:hypothetical protein